MKRSAVGVMNGNFRGGMYYDYRKQVEAGERKEALLRVERMYMEECFQLEGDSFVAWYESDAVPQYGSIQSRIDLIKARIAEIQSQPHPVDFTQAIEREIDNTLEWQDNAIAEHNDWLDENRTMEDAR